MIPLRLTALLISAVLTGFLIAPPRPPSYCSLSVTAYGWRGAVAHGGQAFVSVESMRLEGPDYSRYVDFSGRFLSADARFTGIPAPRPGGWPITYHLYVHYLASYKQPRHDGWSHRLLKSRDVRVRAGESTLRRSVTLSPLEVPGY